MNNDKILKIEFISHGLIDNLNELAAEYTTTTDILVNIAVKRLIDDIELVRNLRSGKTKLL